MSPPDRFQAAGPGAAPDAAPRTPGTPRPEGRGSGPGRRRATRLALAASLVLSACASLDPDAGFGAVADGAEAHIGQRPAWPRNAEQAEASRARVAELLAAPLDAEAAVQVALLQHPGLQARFEALGIAEADRVQASRLPNPGFGFGRTHRGGEREIDRSLGFGLGPLLALPFSGEIATRRSAALQRRLTMELIDHAAAVRRAWAEAVASAELLDYRDRVRDAAAATGELAARMGAVGNFNALAVARQQVFAAQAELDHGRAVQARAAAREQLVRLLGLDASQADFVLPDRLPALPAAPAEAPERDPGALAGRLDLQAARLEVEATARALGLTRALRFVDVLDFSLERNSASDAPPQTGWGIAFELPVFDWGQARVARAEAVYRQSAARAAQAVIDARSQLHEAALAERQAWEVARQHRDVLLPLARRIHDENLLRYNGMLIGVFELVTEARAQAETVIATIESQRDYWIARATLDRLQLLPPPGWTQS